MKGCSYPGPTENFKVLVKTITYNQSTYIQDTLNGVAMQQTDFPFVEVVIDDCSIDGEQSVIKSWLDKNCDMENAQFIDIPTSQVIIVNHKNNSNCSFAIYFLKRNLWKENEEKKKHFKPWEEHCEFIALCEGDDYWTDIHKLQTQVDFLERNPEYSMCFHKSEIRKEIEVDCALRVDLIEDRDYSATELVEHWIAPTASFVLHKECATYPVKNREKLVNGDLPLLLSCCAMGKVRGISSCMSVYRVQDGGITYDKARRKEMYMRFPEHYRTIYLNFPFIKRKIINQLVAYHLFEIAKLEDNKSSMISPIAEAIWISPCYSLRKLFKALSNKIYRISLNEL